MTATRFALLLAVLPATLLAADWPQWRGPDRTGISQETGLLPSWPKDGPKLLWKFSAAGAGYSGPTVVGDKLYSCGSDGKEFVFAVDVKTGTKLWSTPISTDHRQQMGDGPRGNLAVDGEFIYALGGGGMLACLKTDGKLVWSRSLRKDLSGQMMSGWGYSESPLVDGEQVVVTPGGKAGTLAAFNKKTGEVLWRSQAATDSSGYSSVIIAEIAGVRQYVQMTGKGVIGVAPKDGKVLWHYKEGQYRTAVCTTPVVKGNQVFITRGYGVGCDLIDLTANGDGTFKATRAYANENLQNHHGGVILLGDYLYGHSDSKGWVCLDWKTGAVKWSDKGVGKGSVTCAGGLLYCYSERDGTAALCTPTPDGYKEISRFKLPEKSGMHVQYWTHPVVSNGRLYLRDQDLIFCFDIKAK